MRLDDKSESGSNENRVCLCFGTVVFMTLPVMSEKCLQQGVQFYVSTTTSVDILFLCSQQLQSLPIIVYVSSVYFHSDTCTVDEYGYYTLGYYLKQQGSACFMFSYVMYWLAELTT